VNNPQTTKDISFLAFTVATQNPLLVSEMKNQMIAQLSSLVGAKKAYLIAISEDNSGNVLDHCR
jgi:hypothetical protein